jgi:hypothetical protein
MRAFVLWLVVIGLPLGALGPFMQADIAAPGGKLDLSRALAIIIPVVALSVVALYILERYKPEFRKRRE